MSKVLPNAVQVYNYSSQKELEITSFWLVKAKLYHLETPNRELMLKLYQPDKTNKELVYTTCATAQASEETDTVNDAVLTRWIK